MTTLNLVLPGQQCRITQVRGQGALFQRLLEMGLLENTQLRVVRTAPLGDPMEINLHGYHLALRKSEAAMIDVDVVETTNENSDHGSGA